MKTKDAITVCTVEGINSLNSQQLVNDKTLILGEKVDPEDMTAEEKAAMIQRIVKIYESDVSLTKSINSKLKDHERRKASRIIQTLREGNYISFIEKITKFLDKEYGKSSVTLHQRLWHIIHYELKVQMCKVCNHPMIWKENQKEYICKFKHKQQKKEVTMIKEETSTKITRELIIDILKERLSDESCNRYKIISGYYTDEQNDFIEEMTSFLPQNATFAQRMYHIITENYAIPTCPVCGKQTVWNDYLRNYPSYCSHKCLGFHVAVEGRDNLKRLPRLNDIIAEKYGIIKEKEVRKPKVEEDNNNVTDNKEEDMSLKNRKDGLLPQEAYEEIERMKNSEKITGASISSAASVSSDLSVMGNRVYFIQRSKEGDYCLCTGIIVAARLDIETFNKTGKRESSYEVYCTAPKLFNGIQIGVRNGIFARSKQELKEILPNILDMDLEKFVEKQKNDLDRFVEQQKVELEKYRENQVKLYTKYQDIIDLSTIK